MGEEYLTQAQLCELLDISPTTAYRWRKEGMPYERIGKTIRYNRKEVEAWMKSRNAHDEALEFFTNKTKEDLKIEGLIYEFEDEYFSDLTLSDYEEKLTEIEIQDENTGEWITVRGDIIDQGYMTLNNPEFINILKNLISIGKECDGDKITMLRNMIVAYESILSEFPIYQQYVLLKLYEKLITKIPDLMDYIEIDVHKELRLRTPLYMLKSIDLDLRLGLPIGTIYGDDRVSIYEARKSPIQFETVKVYPNNTSGPLF